MRSVCFVKKFLRSVVLEKLSSQVSDIVIELMSSYRSGLDSREKTSNRSSCFYSFTNASSEFGPTQLALLLGSVSWAISSILGTSSCYLVSSKSLKFYSSYSVAGYGLFHCLRSFGGFKLSSFYWISKDYGAFHFLRSCLGDMSSYSLNNWSDAIALNFFDLLESSVLKFLAEYSSWSTGFPQCFLCFFS